MSFTLDSLLIVIPPHKPESRWGVEQEVEAVSPAGTCQGCLGEIWLFTTCMQDPILPKLCWGKEGLAGW